MYHQSFDFLETFSPIVKLVTVLVLLTIRFVNWWSIRKLNFNNALLNGVFDKEVSMAQPTGFVQKEAKYLVCWLNKSLYDLKQVPYSWFHKLKATLASMGFHQSTSDSSLFIYSISYSVLYLLAYINDLSLTDSTT